MSHSDVVQSRLLFADSHCHLDFADFDDDRNAVFARARAAGVLHFLIPAVSRKNWESVMDLSERERGAYAALGLHPCFHPQHRVEDLELLDAALARPGVLAVGECGLDRRDAYWSERQIELFEGQLDLASKHELPIVVHAVRALSEVIAQIRSRPRLCGIVHSFSGSREQARELFDAGFLLGFGGPATWQRSHRIRSVIKYLPLDAIVLESDAPDQSGEQYRGQRNEPAFIVEVAEVVAGLHWKSVAEVAESTTHNVIRLLGLPEEHDV